MDQVYVVSSDEGVLGTRKKANEAYNLVTEYMAKNHWIQYKSQLRSNPYQEYNKSYLLAHWVDRDDRSFILIEVHDLI
jgi:hypothetical protein